MNLLRYKVRTGRESSPEPSVLLSSLTSLARTVLILRNAKAKFDQKGKIQISQVSKIRDRENTEVTETDRNDITYAMHLAQL
jgi:hypothetical protein